MADNQAGWRIDVNQCISCRACEMACKTEYGLQAGQGRRRRVIERTRLDPGDVTRSYFVSVSCHHCQFPACKAACPMSKKLNADGTVKPTDSGTVSALYKDAKASLETIDATRGVVLHNPNRCIGCRKCEWACPYGAPQYNPQTRKMHKCELCWQRQANTALSPERRRPACEGTCLGGAITFAPGDSSLDTDDPSEATGGDEGWAERGSGSGNYLGIYSDHSIDVEKLSTDEWHRPGETVAGVDGYEEGRGSSEMASYLLTYPAIRVRPRVYQTRDADGTVE